MMPNIDPKQMRNLMAKMGIKSSELRANRVVIEGADKDIIIESPDITVIEMQGTMSFQISGRVVEAQHALPPQNITEEDVKMVMEKARVDEATAKSALQKTGGDIAAAILDLKNQG